MKYVTLDNRAVFEAVTHDPHGYIRSLAGTKVVLDEFQYAVELIPASKEASDALSADEKGKFLLTGSADIFRSAKTREALPGHLARLELYPLSLAEITARPSFNLIYCLINENFRGMETPFTDLFQENPGGHSPALVDRDV